MSARTPQWLVIARREFVERVRSMWFVVVTILGPLLMIALIVVPAYTATSGAGDEISVSVRDRSGHNIEAATRKAADRSPINLKLTFVDPNTPDEVLYKGIRDQSIDGFLDFPEGFLESPIAVATYRGGNATNTMMRYFFQQIVSSAVQEMRATILGIGEDQREAFLKPVVVKMEHTTGKAQTASGEASFFLGYLVMFIIYLAIILYAVNVMRGVVQEKTSRVVELIVSATKPRSLMLGKVLGVGSVGLVQMSAWAIMAALLIHYRESVLGLFGVAGAAFALPELGLIDVLVVLGYFLLGYFFYASVFAAVGAMVSSDQEAQQAQTPVMLMLALPVLCVQLVANDPRGNAAQWLTTIPFSSPVLMPMRYLLGGASTGGIIVSMLVLLVSTAGVVWIAARIYRIGILMYGKRPSLGELVRWIRHG